MTTLQRDGMKVQLITLQQEVITEMIGCDESKSLTIMVEGKEIVEDINYNPKL